MVDLIAYIRSLNPKAEKVCIYTEKFMDYFRLDAKIFYKINRKTSHTLAIDVINATNRLNHFLAVYDEDKNDYEEVSNLSIMPVFLWRWNF